MVVFILVYNYGFIWVMSSYYFENIDVGFLYNGDYFVKDVIINVDGFCGNGWVCEYWWNFVVNMVVFRNVVVGIDIKYWRNENDEIFFVCG